MKKRVAIVGAGNWSAHHIASWQRRDDAEITWIVRSSPERAAESARRYGVANASADYRAVLGRDDVDIADILLPHDMHVEAGVFALEQGKHVLLEKPLATTTAGAEALIAAAAAAGRVAMVAENWVFASVVQHAKSVIASGAIGRPYLVRSATDLDVRHMFRGNSWRNDAAHMGGGILMDGGTHNISVLRHLLGEIAEVSAMTGCFTYPDAAPLDDTAAALMRFESGALGVLTTTLGAQVHRPHTAFTVLGTEGTVAFDTHDGSVLLSKSGSRTETVLADASRGFNEQVAHFLDCIAHGRTPITSFSDQLASLRTVLAAYETAGIHRAAHVAA